MTKEILIQKVTEYLMKYYECSYGDAIDLIIGHPDIRDGGDVNSIGERIAQDNFLELRGLECMNLKT